VSEGGNLSKLEQLNFFDSNGNERIVDFISNQQISEGHHTTILTGRNGAFKSTVLREIIHHAVSNSQALENGSSLLVTKGVCDQNEDKLHIIATSGAVADRYPIKSSGGMSTVYDVHNYIYLGQRVGVNLISKKQSLETIAYFLFDDQVRDRYKWSFYDDLFRVVGLQPRLDFEFHTKKVKNRGNERDGYSLYDRASIASTHSGKVENRSRIMGKEKAEFLLNEFSYDDFGELHEFLKSRSSRKAINVSISDGPYSPGLGLNAIRLGLCSGELSLVDVKVDSRSGGDSFSALDLSSGEYHFLSTLLGVGFAIRDGSILLVDEPENSLHPQWQVEFMEMLFGICSFMSDGHVLVSTHSPLIVSSANMGSTVIDLSRAGDFVPESRILFGASADDILLDHFGLSSSRNFSLVERLQKAISLFEAGGEKSDEFISMKPELQRLITTLRSGDPLIEVIEALLDGGEN